MIDATIIISNHVKYDLDYFSLGSNKVYAYRLVKQALTNKWVLQQGRGNGYSKKVSIDKNGKFINLEGSKHYLPNGL